MPFSNPGFNTNKTIIDVVEQVLFHWLGVGGAPGTNNSSNGRIDFLNRT
jgi:hypothetical protein